MDNYEIEIVLLENKDKGVSYDINEGYFFKSNLSGFERFGKLVNGISFKVESDGACKILFSYVFNDNDSTNLEFDYKLNKLAKLKATQRLRTP